MIYQAIKRQYRTFDSELMQLKYLIRDQKVSFNSNIIIKSKTLEKFKGKKADLENFHEEIIKIHFDL